MEKEFEDYWNAHRKRMLLNAPRELREEYLESTKLDSPMDWVCFVLPVAVGSWYSRIYTLQARYSHGL